MVIAIKQKIKCQNHVRAENGSVLCGIYQTQDEIKTTWLCDECLQIN